MGLIRLLKKIARDAMGLVLKIRNKLYDHGCGRETVVIFDVVVGTTISLLVLANLGLLIQIVVVAVIIDKGVELLEILAY